LLLYFTAAWCGPCRLLEREVFAHPTGQAELQNFDLVRLDLDSESGRAVADSFRVANVPTFVMLDPAGQEIERITGYRSRRLLVHDLARFRAGHGTRDDLERRLARAPADPVLQSELGLRHHARLDLAAAAELLGSGLRRSVPAARHPRGVRRPGPGRCPRRARENRTRPPQVIERLLDQWPDHPYPRASWQLLASYRHQTGDQVAAVAALEAAAGIDPPRPAVLLRVRPGRGGGRQAARGGRGGRPAGRVADQAGGPGGHGRAGGRPAQAPPVSRSLLWIRRAMEAAPDDPAWGTSARRSCRRRSAATKENRQSGPSLTMSLRACLAASEQQKEPAGT
jgi:thiol-disulfide isomerase/thioredoxin